MMFLKLLVLVVVLAISFYFWPKDQRSLRTIVATAAVMVAILGIGDILVRLIPIERKVNEVKVVTLKYKQPPKVVYRDKPVFVTPGAEYQPVDTEALCKGKGAIKVDQVTVSGKTDDKDTWILGTPLGHKVQVTCRVPGSYDDFYHEGSVLQLPSNGDNK